MKQRKTHLFFAMVLGGTIWSCSNEDLEHNDLRGSFENGEVEISIIDTTTQVTQKLAEKVATNFFPTSRSYLEVLNTELINDDSGEPSFYIVNYKNNNGFIVVSATQNYMPILGYSTEGNFNTANMTQSNIAYWVELQKEITHLQDEIPDSCKREFNKMWRKYISNNIKMAKTRADNDEVEQLIRSSVTKWQQEGYTVYTMNNYIYSSEYQSLSESKKEEIKHSLTMHANPNYGDIYSKSFMLVKEESEGSQQNQLLSTTWGQQNGFNQYTPNQYPAGCVAVAVGQIMKYHQYPTSFNWNGMPNTYATETTARFLKDVGESVDTKYNADGSSAKIEDALSALKNVYGYTNARKVDHNSDDVLKQLDLKRPVYMRGYDPVGILGLKRNGHAWVCDGYSASSKTTTWILKTLEDTPTGITPRKFTSAYTDTEVSSFIYFHMNWGWSGSYNGMYYYNDVNIPELDLNFSHGRENIIDIYPTNN